MAPRLTGTSPLATATALCTEAATAWRAAARGEAQWGGQPPATAVGKQGTQAEGALRVLALTAGTRGAGGICALRLLHSLGLHQGPCSFVRMGVRGHSTHTPLGAAPCPVSIPGLLLCRGAGCAARALSRSSGAFLLPWGLCEAGAVGLGERRLPRRCRPSSTSARRTGTGAGTSTPGVTPAH